MNTQRCTSTLLRFLPPCLAVAWACGAPAYAATITGLQAEAGYTLDGSPAVTLPTQTATPPGTTSVDILQFTGDGFNNIGIHTYADSPSASFGSRASGDGDYDAGSLITVTGTFSGDTFSSTVIPGQIYVQIPAGYVFDPGEFVSAHLQFSLAVDGGTPFLSDALLNWSAAGLTSSTSESANGFNIGYTLTTGATFANYSFPSSTQTINGLGGGDHTFVYTILAEAHGLTHPVTCAGGGGSDGHGGINEQVAGEPGQGSCQPGSGAQSGDPLHALPEPGTAVLFGLGAAVLARSSRRGRKQAQPVSPVV